MKFESEIHMNDKFTDFLRSKLSDENYSIFNELKGLIGIPDIVIIQKDEFTINHVISIELKLYNWNRALKQAFKYRNFSNESYVILNDLNNIESIVDNFITANIGLATFNQNGELRIHHIPQNSKPFSEYFIKKFENKINSEYLKGSNSPTIEYFYDVSQYNYQNIFMGVLQ